MTFRISYQYTPTRSWVHHIPRNNQHPLLCSRRRYGCLTASRWRRLIRSTSPKVSSIVIWCVPHHSNGSQTTPLLFASTNVILCQPPGSRGGLGFGRLRCQATETLAPELSRNIYFYTGQVIFNQRHACSPYPFIRCACISLLYLNICACKALSR